MADTRVDELRQRLERDPGSRLFAQLAEEHRKAGDLAEAVRVARGGLVKHPHYPSARLTLGRALLEAGDAAAARVELETALKGAPDNILASRFLGEALEALGDLGSALLQYRATLKIAPGDRHVEGRIRGIEARLGAPRPPAPASGTGLDITTPMAAARQVPASPRPQAAGTDLEGTGEGEVPPTIRIHMPGDPAGRWARPKPPAPPIAPTPVTPLELGPAPPSLVVTERLPAPPGGGPPAPGPPPLPSTAPVASAAPTAVQTLPLPGRVPPAPVAAEPFYESDVAPTLPTALAPEVVSLEEPLPPTLPPRTVGGEPPAEQAYLAEPAGRSAAEPAVGTDASGTPFSSSTLAELYFQQGLADRAIEVYRQLLQEEPGNERARARLAELQTLAAAEPPVDPRATRRRALERTIAALERLLAAVRRR